MPLTFRYLLTFSSRTVSRNFLSHIRDVAKTKRTRDRERVFVLEGTKPILELVRSAPRQIVCLVVAPTFLDRQSPEVVQEIVDSGCTVHTCPEHQLAQLSDVETSSGALAIVHQPTWDQAAILARPRVFGLYGDMLQDPANIGTIIRTAAGLDVSALWMAPHSVDVFNPKVVRATAGTLFQLPIFSHTTLENLLALGCTILAADVGPGDGSVPIRSIQSIPARTIVAIGSESRGLSDAVLDAATVRLTIPLKSGVESLNAATAAAIALFHLSGLPVEHNVAH
ncbi:MAG: Putative 23S rRNA methyltransferase RlmB [Nitrospira sp.]|nr:MAG: Putative 23S rRNA methyltransferase RlmB [Nitrospira sp.]